MKTKTCKTCKITKLISEYHRDRNSYKSNCKVCRAIKRKKRSSIPKLTFNEYKRGAIKRNLEFKISLKDFTKFFGSRCKYCNAKLEKISLDRVDNSRGYTIDNVTPCCKTCNFMKYKLSQDEFLNHVKKIYEYQREK